MIFLIITTIVVKNIIRISNDIGNDLIPKTFDNISLNQLKFNNIEVFIIMDQNVIIQKITMFKT